MSKSQLMRLQDLREEANEFGLCKTSTETRARTFGEGEKSTPLVVWDADFRIQIRLGRAATRHVRVWVLAQPTPGLEDVGLRPALRVVVDARYVHHDSTIGW